MSKPFTFRAYRLIVLGAALVVFSAPAAFAQIKFKKRGKAPKPECFCTDSTGARKELGDIICLTVGDRSYEAKCVMAQNNPFWRDLERGCLNSQLKSPAPAIQHATTIEPGPDAPRGTPLPQDYAALYRD